MYPARLNFAGNFFNLRAMESSKAMSDNSELLDHPAALCLPRAPDLPVLGEQESSHGSSLNHSSHFHLYIFRINNLELTSRKVPGEQ